VAHSMALLVIGGLLLVPLWNVARLLRNPAWRRRIKKGRVLLSWAVLVTAAAGACMVPLPFRVTAPAVLEPQDGHHVYVSVPGTLVAAAPAGAYVERGQTLAQLTDLDIRMQIEELIGQRNQQLLHVKNLEFRLVEDPSVAPQIPSAKEALADIDERLRQRQRDEKRLTLAAPAGGTVLPPPGVAAHPYVPGRLQTWWGSPLEPRNLGCRLTPGTLLCLVGDPARLEAVLIVDQSNLVFVKHGQRVRMQFDELPATVLDGTVTEIAKTDLKVVPRELAMANELPTRVDENGVHRPLNTSYQVRVSLDGHEGMLLTGARGRAKILADPQPLGRRLYRYLRRTFNFPL